MTGTGNFFYPDYASDDPYAAYNRGYYFHGSAIMQLPPNTEDSTLTVTFGAESTLTFWLRAETDGVLFSKQTSTGSYD